MGEFKDWSRTSSYKMKFAYNFSFDITDRDLRIYSGLSMPFAGQWSLEVYREDAQLVLRLTHGELSLNQLGFAVAVNFEFVQLDKQNVEHVIESAAWPKRKLPAAVKGGGVYTAFTVDVPQYKWQNWARESGRYQPKTHRRYRLNVTFEEDYPENPAGAIARSRNGGLKQGREEGREEGKKEGREEGKKEGREEGRKEGRQEGLREGLEKGRREGLEQGRNEARPPPVYSGALSFPFLSLLSLSDLTASHTANDDRPALNDIRLVFPAANGKPERELWAKSAVLTSHSSFFAELLSSDFTQSVIRRPGAEDAVNDDSDEETDAISFSHQAIDRAPTVAHGSYRQIKITYGAFSTWRAVLISFTEGYVSYSSLTSSFPSGTHATRRAYYLNLRGLSSPNPLPTSPKSIYRLADFLGIPELKRMALAEFSRGISVKNAAFELFGSASVSAELRAASLAFVKANLVAVKASEGWKAAVRRIQAGEIAGAVVGPVLVELMKMGVTL
jgi:hypothetical protein